MIESPASTKPFYFLHVPKTAGISINYTLAAIFPPEKICSGWNWDLLLKIPNGELRRYELFGGHLGGGLEDYLGWKLREFTVLRDPLARAISQYDQILRAPSSPEYETFLRMGSFSGALRDPAGRRAFSNFQAHELVSEEIPGNLRSANPAFDTDEKLLAAALRRLERMECVGITERLSEFVDLFCHTFDWIRPRENFQLNVNPVRARADSMSAEDRQLLLEMNPVDLALHAYASQRMAADLERMAEHRRAHPEVWLQRHERRIAKLCAVIESQHAELVESRRQLTSVGGRLGKLVQGTFDRLLPPGSALRKRLKGLKRAASWLRR